MEDIKGKNVLVTGGGSGIGQGIAVGFAKSGANVAINYSRSIEGARETERLVQETCQAVKDCGVTDLLVKGDVSKEDDVKEMFHEVVQTFGGVDILINNAGIQMEGYSHEIPMDKFDKVININLRGAYMCSREAIKHFLSIPKPGVIINISSVHESIPKPGYIGYSVSKGGMRNITQTLALEYSEKNIRINAVAPGAIITPINRSWIDDPERKAAIEAHIPIRRAGSVEDIASVVVFLASDLASYIIGQTIYVDGGLTLYPGFKESWTS
jgi:glucose 1-dehydrogenase